jgi:hypothetical protein
VRRGSGRSGRKIDYRKNKKGHKLLKKLAYKYDLTRRKGK